MNDQAITSLRQYAEIIREELRSGRLGFNNMFELAPRLFERCEPSLVRRGVVGVVEDIWSYAEELGRYEDDGTFIIDLPSGETYTQRRNR